jgi:CspA family cold shock protein
MRFRSTVKWFDARRGFGFIELPESHRTLCPDDLFVHYSQIVTEESFRVLRTGQHVEFDLVRREKGFHAERVEVVDEECER